MDMVGTYQTGQWAETVSIRGTCWSTWMRCAARKEEVRSLIACAY